MWNISTRISPTPRSALAILNEYSPDIIFLDGNMLGFDCFEAFAYIKHVPGLLKIPIVIVTSDDQLETTERSLIGGAHAIIIKPVWPVTLEAALN